MGTSALSLQAMLYKGAEETVVQEAHNAAYSGVFWGGCVGDILLGGLLLARISINLMTPLQTGQGQRSQPCLQQP